MITKLQLEYSAQIEEYLCYRKHLFLNSKEIFAMGVLQNNTVVTDVFDVDSHFQSLRPEELEKLDLDKCSIVASHDKNNSEWFFITDQELEVLYRQTWSS